MIDNGLGFQLVPGYLLVNVSLAGK